MSSAGRTCKPGCQCGHHVDKSCKPGCICGKHKMPYNKGKLSPLKGRKHSKDVVANQVASRRNGKGWVVSEEQREKIRLAITGKKHSEETKKKIGNARLGFQWSNEEKQKLSSSALKRVKRDFSKNPTSIERKVLKELNDIGIDYKFQEILFDTYTVDFLIPDRNLIIECDGAYWHNRPQAIIRDKNRDAWLSRRGYTTIRLIDKDINRDPKTTVLSALGEY